MCVSTLVNLSSYADLRDVGSWTLPATDASLTNADVSINVLEVFHAHGYGESGSGQSSPTIDTGPAWSVHDSWATNVADFSRLRQDLIDHRCHVHVALRHRINPGVTPFGANSCWRARKQFD